MTHISTAKSSLRAELAHVQSGLAYYQARVEALHEAIQKLDEIEEEDEIALEPEGKKSTGRRKASAKATSKASVSARQPRQGRNKSRLPATGGDFFPALLTEQKQSMAELLRAAVAQLPFKASAEERNQLRARLTSAMIGMLKAGKAHDEGKGRERVYFKA